MRRASNKIAFGIVIAGSLAYACKSDPAPDPHGGIADDGTVILANNACHDLEPVHKKPECDGCTRDWCCVEVLDCDKAADCKAARLCIAACKEEDLDCKSACHAGHPQGVQLQANIDRCAGLKCPVACDLAFIGDDVRDAGRD